MSDSKKNKKLRGQINTVILLSLADSDKYGYEIGKEIEDKTKGQYTLKEPTLYSSLRRLEESGFVSSYYADDVETHGGRRKYYTLTDDGKTFVSSVSAQWEYNRTIFNKLISDKEFVFDDTPRSNSEISLDVFKKLDSSSFFGASSRNTTASSDNVAHSSAVPIDKQTENEPTNETDLAATNTKTDENNLSDSISASLDASKNEDVISINILRDEDYADDDALNDDGLNNDDDLSNETADNGTVSQYGDLREDGVIENEPTDEDAETSEKIAVAPLTYDTDENDAIPDEVFENSAVSTEERFENSVNHFVDDSDEEVYYDDDLPDSIPENRTVAMGFSAKDDAWEEIDAKEQARTKLFDPDYIPQKGVNATGFAAPDTTDIDENGDEENIELKQMTKTILFDPDYIPPKMPEPEESEEQKISRERTKSLLFNHDYSTAEINAKDGRDEEKGSKDIFDKISSSSSFIPEYPSVENTDQPDTTAYIPKNLRSETETSDVFELKQTDGVQEKPSAFTEEEMNYTAVSDEEKRLFEQKNTDNASEKTSDPPANETEIDPVIFSDDDNDSFSTEQFTEQDSGQYDRDENIVSGEESFDDENEDEKRRMITKSILFDPEYAPPTAKDSNIDESLFNYSIKENDAAVSATDKAFNKPRQEPPVLKEPEIDDLFNREDQFNYFNSVGESPATEPANKTGNASFKYKRPDSESEKDKSAELQYRTRLDSLYRKAQFDIGNNKNKTVSDTYANSSDSSASSNANGNSQVKPTVVPLNFSGAASNAKPNNDKGYSVRAYDPSNDRGFKNRVFVNRLLRDGSFIMYAFILVEAMLCYLFLDKVVMLGILPYAITALVSLALPIGCSLNFALFPKKHVYGRFNERSFIMNALLIFVYSFFAIVVINLLVKISFSNTADIILRVIYPTILLSNVAIGAVIYSLLHTSKRYHI